MAWHFNARQKGAIEILKEVQSFVNAQGVAVAQDLLREAVEKVQRHTFRVAVLGRFSGGKSTLINALLNYDLLPTHINPTTKQLVFLHPAQKLTLHFSEDGHPVWAFTRLSEMRNRLAILAQEPHRYPEIHLYLPLAFPNVILIDTPGFQDEDAATSLVLEALPRFDGALFVFDAAVQTESELKRFRQIAAAVPVFCVFNRTDALTQGEQDIHSVRQRFRQILSAFQELPSATCPALPFVSAYLALRAKQWQNDPTLWERLKQEEPHLALQEKLVGAPEGLLARSGFPAFEETFRAWLQNHPNWQVLRAVQLARQGLEHTRAAILSDFQKRLAQVEAQEMELQPRLQRIEAELEALAQEKSAFLRRTQEVLEVFQNRWLTEVQEALEDFERRGLYLLKTTPPTELRQAMLRYFRSWEDGFHSHLRERFAHLAASSWEHLSTLDPSGRLNVTHIAIPSVTVGISYEVAHPWPTTLSDSPQSPLEAALAALPEKGFLNFLRDWWHQDLVPPVRRAFSQKMETVRRDTLADLHNVWREWQSAVLRTLDENAGRERKTPLENQRAHLQRQLRALHEERAALQERQRALLRQIQAFQRHLESLEERARTGAFALAEPKKEPRRSSLSPLSFSFLRSRRLLVAMIGLLLLFGVLWVFGPFPHP